MAGFGTAPYRLLIGIGASDGRGIARPAEEPCARARTHSRTRTLLDRKARLRPRQLRCRNRLRIP